MFKDIKDELNKRKQEQKESLRRIKEKEEAIKKKRLAGKKGIIRQIKPVDAIGSVLEEKRDERTIEEFNKRERARIQEARELRKAVFFEKNKKVLIAIVVLVGIMAVVGLHIYSHDVSKDDASGDSIAAGDEVKHTDNDTDNSVSAEGSSSEQPEAIEKKEDPFDEEEKAHVEEEAPPDINFSKSHDDNVIILRYNELYPEDSVKKSQVTSEKYGWFVITTVKFDDFSFEASQSDGAPYYSCFTKKKGKKKFINHASRLIRAVYPFITDDEYEKILDDLKSQGGTLVAHEARDYHFHVLENFDDDNRYKLVFYEDTVSG